MTAMTHSLFVFDALKTGGDLWRHHLAPKLGALDQLPGFQVYLLQGYPFIAPDPTWKGIVYGEVFTGLPSDLLERLDQLMVTPELAQRHEVTATGVGRVWTYIINRVPVSAVPLQGGRVRSPMFTRGLAALARELMAGLGPDASAVAERALAFTIRDEVRPLAQANWASIPWRTSPRRSEWELAQAYVERLAGLAEIGL